MSSDRTQQQSSEHLKRARDLSLEPTRPPADVPGYQLQQFLGSGAYGEVWSALDQKTGRRVAIKFYTRRSAADVQLLATEVEKLVVLAADRYVVQLLDVGWDAEPPHYVMDYIEHGSLEDRLKSGSSLSTSEAIELFTEVATGMMHLHGKGILHCDLKPGNVLLDQDGKPRLADFGQSRLSTDQSPALGTLFYMAPEQADLKAMPDAKWDVYGLGALLFSMLTGKPPCFSAQLTNKIESSVDISERLNEYRDAIRSSPKPIEHRSVRGVDRMLAEIIDRCIAADPADRFDSIQSVLLALRQREMSRARRPVMLLGLLGPLLLTTVMSVFGYWAYNEAVLKTDHAIMAKATESNQFASRLAARSAAEQMDQFFQAVVELSRDKAFLTTFDEFSADQQAQQLTEAVAHPRLNKIEVPARQQLIDLPVRQKLQPFLQERLDNLNGSYPEAASWLVNDRAGNQVASVFHGENTTLGKNYAYRTYFTGLDRDLKDVDSAGGETYRVPSAVADRSIIDRPHLSAVFSSKQSNTWKIAFSAPVVRAGEVRGIVFVTVELGSFIDFENAKKHYAMMIDGRQGDSTGAILEHPLFQDFANQNQRIPDELAALRIDPNKVATQPVKQPIFYDPIGKSKPGKAAGYDRRALAAIAPVTVRSRLMARPKGLAADASVAALTPVDPVALKGETVFAEDERIETGLHVLAVESYDDVIEPAHELGRRLGTLSAWAVLFLSLVALGLWLLVNHMLKESRERMARAFSPSNRSVDGTGLNPARGKIDNETIAGSDGMGSSTFRSE